MSRKIIPWRCPKGHILGVISKSGSGIRTLIVFRESLQEFDLRIKPAQILFETKYGTKPVTCSICGGINTWIAHSPAGKDSGGTLLMKYRNVYREDIAGMTKKLAQTFAQENKSSMATFEND